MPVVYPPPFLEVRYYTLDPNPPTTGLCAGYDGGVWRSARFADHLFNWLPYAALSQEHQLAFSAHNFVEMLRLAAAHIYNTKKTTTRGEIGELILHLACILQFKTIPVMCKLVLKTSSNDTVKGFDGVHLLPKDDTSFELWLGESKFYIDPEDAIREAIKSIKEHILPSFLTTEKAMIFGHVAPDIPHREEVIKLFRSQTSGDELLMVAHSRRDPTGIHTAPMVGWAWSQLNRIKTLPKFLRWFSGVWFEDDKAAGVDAAFQFLQACEFSFPRTLAAAEAIVLHLRPDEEVSYGPYIVGLETWFRPAWMKELDEAGIPIPLAERLAPHLSDPTSRINALEQISRLNLSEITGFDEIDRFIVSLSTS